MVGTPEIHYAQVMRDVEKLSTELVIGSLMPGEAAAGKVAGGVLKGFTKHGINQAISRDEVGVATEAILNAVKNPEKVVPQAQGKLKYVGENATVILNNVGKVVTTWARNSLGWRIEP